MTRQGVIAPATLLILGGRILRSTRRTAFIARLSQALVEARLQAKRVHKRWKHPLPALLVSFRAALGPGIIFGAWLSHRGWLPVACIALALLSGIFDGGLARHWGTDTEALRRIPAPTRSSCSEHRPWLCWGGVWTTGSWIWPWRGAFYATFRDWR